MVADGIVRLYRNYDPDVSGTSVQMVSSFRGLNETLRMKQGAGLITNWKQNGGHLLVGGDSRIIRVWDAHTEAQLVVCTSHIQFASFVDSFLQDMETDSNSPVTAMSSEEGVSKVFLASFADGTIKVFDRRMEEEDAIVRAYPGAHSAWVQNVKMQPSLSGQFLSAR
jgi:regulatory associated protein of mTOR